MPIGDLKWDPAKNQWFDPATNAHYTQWGPTWYNPANNQTYRVADRQISDPSGAPVPPPPADPQPSLWDQGKQLIASVVLGDGTPPPNPTDSGADTWADGFKQSLMNANWRESIATTFQKTGDAMFKAADVAVSSVIDTASNLPDQAKALVSGMTTDQLLPMVQQAWHESSIGQVVDILKDPSTDIASTISELPGVVGDELSQKVDYYSAHPQSFQDDACNVAGNALFQAVTGKAVEMVAGAVSGSAPPGEAPPAGPAEPLAPPVEPVAPPVEPVAPPVEPVAPPVEPVAPPVEPVAPEPVAAVDTPTQIEAPPDAAPPGPAETPTQVGPPEGVEGPSQPQPGSDEFRNAQTQRIDRFEPGERVHYRDVPEEPTFSPAEGNPPPSTDPTVRLSPEETFGTSPGGTPESVPTAESNPDGFRGARTEVLDESAPTRISGPEETPTQIQPPPDAAPPGPAEPPPPAPTEPAPTAPGTQPAADAGGGGAAASPDQTQIIEPPQPQVPVQPAEPAGAGGGLREGAGPAGGGADAGFGANPAPEGWDPATMDTRPPNYEEVMGPEPQVWTDANQPAYQANSSQDILERISGTSERFPGDAMTRASEFGNREMLDAAYDRYADGLREVERLANSDPEYWDKLPQWQAERMQSQMTFDEATRSWQSNPTPKSYFEEALERNLREAGGP
ncbi:MAG TPA: hypothetical protein VK277_04475 [Acidimicrobiales bacterium]|nr:hypothetical protein [Acidimicrobiales bacterium]